jgi:hypothetical protein
MTPQGTVYVMDMMTDATHTAPKFSALFAVNMALTTTSGWVFSSAELTEWAPMRRFYRCGCGALAPSDSTLDGSRPQTDRSLIGPA